MLPQHHVAEMRSGPEKSQTGGGRERERGRDRKYGGEDRQKGTQTYTQRERYVQREARGDATG